MSTEDRSSLNRRDFFKLFLNEGKKNPESEEKQVSEKTEPTKGFLDFLLNWRMNRRGFMRHTSLAGAAVAFSPAIEMASNINGLEMLQTEIETLLKGRNISVSILEIDLKTGRKNSEISVNQEKKLPVASAFKAMVLLWYLEHVPVDEWSFDKGSDAYNMIVYSHNKATGEMLHATAEIIRKTSSESEVTDKNDIELFNDYLDSIGVGAVMSAWGFNSATEDQVDDRYMNRKVKTRKGNEVIVDNIATAEQLAAFYEYFINKRLNTDSENRVPYEVFSYLCSISDLRYLSPLEKQFLGHNFLGKDGYLTPDTWPGVGTTRVDAGVIQTTTNKAVIVSMFSFDDSGVVLDDVGNLIANYYLGNEEKKDGQQFELFDLSETTRGIIVEKMPSKFSGIEQIDQIGLIEPTAKDVEFLSEVTQNLEGRELGLVISVNLFSGELGAFNVSDGSAENVFKRMVLTGERLPYGKDAGEIIALKEKFTTSRFSSTGQYDAQHGIFFNQKDQVPRHTFTRPMICVFEGASAANGFGDLDTNKPVPFFVMKMLEEGDQSQAWSKSSLNSQITIHAVPTLAEDDKAYAHYSDRGKILEIVNDLMERGLKKPEGYDSNWSHACVNMRRGDYDELLALANQTRAQNQSVIVVFTYNDQDLETLVLQNNFDDKDDPFYGNNLSISLGKGFESY